MAPCDRDARRRAVARTRCDVNVRLEMVAVPVSAKAFSDARHGFLRHRGVEISDVQAYPWHRFCSFSDPDGNGWSVHGPA
jgi:hypothetical protein